MSTQEKVLIIEDDEDLRHVFSSLLEQKGYETTAVGSATEGRRAARSGQFDVALVDDFLPDSKGIELIAPLKENQEDIAIIVITGHASIESAIRAVNAGAAGYLTKPVAAEALLAKVSQTTLKQRLLLGRGGAEGEPGALQAASGPFTGRRVCRSRG
ncbi:MAG: response regulator [Planctomycetota bacterium]|jgi:two-component system response regulator AtoC